MKTIRRILIVMVSVSAGFALFFGVIQLAKAGDRALTARERVMFEAWIKLYPNTVLTFEEWRTLRRNDLLPKCN